MSNIIPFVSSSPPPMDEDQTFGWDEEEDDFGNFAAAPTFESPTERDDGVSEGGFVADWPAAGFTPGTTPSKECSPESGGEAESTAGDSGSQQAAHQGAEDHDFTHFAAFQEKKADKPHLASLPLETSPPHRWDAEVHRGTGKETETGMEKSRESTATDSGLFSSDMSPLPQCESLCLSEGDKPAQSDDETFSDMPEDRQPCTLPPGDAAQEPGQCDLSPDPWQDEDGEGKGASAQSDTPVCADDRDGPEGLGVGEGTDTSDDVSDAHTHDNRGGSWSPSHSSCSAVPAAHSARGHDPPPPEAPRDTDRSTSQSPEGRSSVAKVGNSCVRKEGLDSCSLPDTGATEVAGHCPSPSCDPPAPVTQDSAGHSWSKSSDENNEDETDDDDWAAFESKPSLTEDKEDSGEEAEPEDLVLRKDSINFDDEDNGDALEDTSTGENGQPTQTEHRAEGAGEDGQTDSSVTHFSHSEDRPSPDSSPHHLTDAGSGSGLHANDNTECQQCAPLDKSVDIASVPTADISPERKEGHCCADDDDSFGDFRGEAVPVQTTPSPGQGGSKQFAKFSSADAAQDNSEKGFGGFSSSPAPGAKEEEDDDDEFGEFNSGSSNAAATSSEKDFGGSSNKSTDPAAEGDDFDAFHGPSAASSEAEVQRADADDFGAFSNRCGDAACDSDFGDFSAQPAACSESAWADFGGSAKPSASDDDFGNFSASAKLESSDKVDASTGGAKLSSPAQDVRVTKLEAALKMCFPWSGTGDQVRGDQERRGEEGVDILSSDKRQLGVLETILEYGLLYRSASQQTWQVVQHPSRKDPRVRLWGHLQDVDGSPAVVYQWGKSCTNAHLFTTLHIDTQNMLIGHKKRPVPIFATGLSLLEPIRGGRKEREAGGSIQGSQNTASSVLSPTLVDSSGQEPERRSQEIPAVDFDWSTSGLTNPLTSHSLDLDFLVAQDSHASDRPSVFQSELLDAPRSSVKSSQPLEDILKNAKPTSVRSRRDDAATTQMSAEAVRVLAGLPDLSFMQSKVLMFPIKN